MAAPAAWRQRFQPVGIVNKTRKTVNNPPVVNNCSRFSAFLFRLCVRYLTPGRFQMRSTQKGYELCFGRHCVIPPLPAGFTIRKSAYAAIARAPGTRQAFIIALHPPRLVPITCRKGPHTFADFQNATPL
jgi:hypothetical protein